MQYEQSFIILVQLNYDIAPRFGGRNWFCTGGVSNASLPGSRNLL